MNCNVCDSTLKPLFTSTYCAYCDKNRVLFFYEGYDDKIKARMDFLCPLIAPERFNVVVYSALDSAKSNLECKAFISQSSKFGAIFQFTRPTSDVHGKFVFGNVRMYKNSRIDYDLFKVTRVHMHSFV